MEEKDRTRTGFGSWISNTDGTAKRNALLWIEIVVCIFFYICSRYDYQRKQIKLETLRKELVDLQYQSLNVTSSVSAKSKPSYIESVVSKEGNGLSTMSDSPFVLP